MGANVLVVLTALFAATSIVRAHDLRRIVT